MRIKTITCHDVYNHGASLQAFALQEYLRSLGHDVQIIDYKPDYLSQHYRLDDVNPVYDRPIIRWLYMLAKLPSRMLQRPRKWAFDRFRRKYLSLTKRYHSNEELKKDPPQADVYICGSDQIWNTIFPNGKDPAFYLDFAPPGKKRVSYAASFATKEIESTYFSFVANMISKLDFVSIRERSALLLLQSLGREDGVAVCDPVFLLERSFWSEFSGKVHESIPYMVVYDFEKSETVRRLAETIAVKCHLKIFNIGPYRLSYADKNYSLIGPRDFVRLIRDARFVISNSFHATAYAIIFQIPFYVVNRSEAINERMKSLLADFSLTDRIVNDSDNMPISIINYAKIEKCLNDEITRSKQFLSEVVSQ